MRADAATMCGAVLSLLAFLLGLETSLGLNWNPVPRKTVRYQGKWAAFSRTYRRPNFVPAEVQGVNLRSLARS